MENADIVDAVTLPESLDIENINPSENFSLPNAVIKCTTNMNDILDWPETPIRKGTKVQKTKKSYVLTNSIWIEEETKRKEAKRKIETEKEEKKAERLKKQALKNNEKKTKTSKKTKK